MITLPPKGYYDEEGYYRREPPRGGRGGGRRGRRPIRDPYYEKYRGREGNFGPGGRRGVARAFHSGAPPRRITTSEFGIFSPQEIKDLTIATLVLAVAFTLVMGGSARFTAPVAVFIAFFPISLIATATAFTAHEMSHKFMAQKHGLPAEFVLNPTGILIALATAFLIGFLFALPGAVVFSGAGADKRIVGKVGAAGPATNIVLALLFLPLMLYVWGPLYIVVLVNAFLAGFNMLPLGPFDGLKVWRWNPLIYMLMMGMIALLLVVSFFPELLFA